MRVPTDQPPSVTGRGADLDNAVGDLHRASVLVDDHREAGAFHDSGQHRRFDREMRFARMAHLVEHRPDLLDQARKAAGLLFFRDLQAAARRNDDVIVAAGKHCAAVGAGRDQVAGRKRGADRQ